MWSRARSGCAPCRRTRSRSPPGRRSSRCPRCAPGAAPCRAPARRGRASPSPSSFDFHTRFVDHRLPGAHLALDQLPIFGRRRGDHSCALRREEVAHPLLLPCLRNLGAHARNDRRGRGGRREETEAIEHVVIGEPRLGKRRHLGQGRNPLLAWHGDRAHRAPLPMPERGAAARAALVLDDELLPELFAEFRRERPRRDVGKRTRRERHHDAHGFRRPGLRPQVLRHERQRDAKPSHDNFSCVCQALAWIEDHTGRLNSFCSAPTMACVGSCEQAMKSASLSDVTVSRASPATWSAVMRPSSSTLDALNVRSLVTRMSDSARNAVSCWFTTSPYGVTTATSLAPECSSASTIARAVVTTGLPVICASWAASSASPLGP